jgi:hypothetical protein
MAEIVGGLFGVSPEQLVRQRQATDTANAFRFAQLAPLEQAKMSIYQGSAGLGRGISGLLGGDPELERVSQIKQLSSQFDLTTAQGARDFARALQPFAPQEAMMAVREADRIEQSGLGRQKTVAETTLAEARTQAALREKTGSSYRTLTPAEARARGLSPSASYQVEEGTNKVTQIGQGPAVVFNAPLVGAEKAYAGKVGSSAADRDIAQFGTAEAAVNNLNKINETLGELRTGTAITGAFADVQKNIQKVQAKFANDKKAGKSVSDTEYLDALLGSDVFPMISSLGIGARGLDTPAEREFLRQVMTGTVSLEKDTIVKLTEQRKRIAERAIDKFNERVDKGELNKFFEYQGITPQKFDKPKAAPTVRQPGQPPAGVDARVWNAMTEQERALWK